MLSSTDLESSCGCEYNFIFPEVPTQLLDVQYRHVHRAFYDGFCLSMLCSRPVATLQSCFFQVTSKYLAGFQLVFSLMDWVLQAWSIKAQE